MASDMLGSTTGTASISLKVGLRLFSTRVRTHGPLCVCKEIILEGNYFAFSTLVRTHGPLCACVCVCARARLCTYVYTYMNIYMYIHEYIPGEPHAHKRINAGRRP